LEAKEDRWGSGEINISTARGLNAGKFGAMEFVIRKTEIGKLKQRV